MGDPAGVGPELIVTVLADRELAGRCRPLIVGDLDVIRAGAAATGVTLELRPVDEPTALDAGVAVYCPPGGAVTQHRWGRTSAASGRAALAALTAAALSPCDGLVSAPLQKESLRLAGMRHADELGLLTELTHSDDPALIGILPALWTICVTSHVPLRAVPELITRDTVRHAIERLAAALTPLHPGPRIAVAGLNPHAGEGGHLGREELDVIGPAIEDARASGLDVSGPLSPDTAFPQALAEGRHGLVCMYHDQANIARKLQPRAAQATLYLGLPVPVATTAHGTALDLAGTGTADPASLRAALETTIALA